VQLFKDAIVVNKSEPSQKEKEEVLTITVVVEIHAVVMVVEMVEKTVVVETEEDINIPFY
jgi:hypothetical protein